jgi:hypothetical protein
VERESSDGRDGWRDWGWIALFGDGAVEADTKEELAEELTGGGGIETVGRGRRRRRGNRLAGDGASTWPA